MSINKTLVNAFITTGNQDQCIQIRQLAYRRLSQLTALGGQVNHLRRLPGCCLGLNQSIFQGLDLHHHARTTAKRAIVHSVMSIRRVVSRIPTGELQEPLFHRPTGDAVLADGGEHLGKQTDHFYAQVSHA
ncbi:hypothetical protein D3C76_934750 [compost metagenome]